MTRTPALQTVALGVLSFAVWLGVGAFLEDPGLPVETGAIVLGIVGALTVTIGSIAYAFDVSSVDAAARVSAVSLTGLFVFLAGSHYLTPRLREDLSPATTSVPEAVFAGVVAAFVLVPVAVAYPYALAAGTGRRRFRRACLAVAAVSLVGALAVVVETSSGGPGYVLRNRGLPVLVVVVASGVFVAAIWRRY